MYVPHAPPISIFLISSPEKYLVRSTDHKAPHSVVFSTLLFLDSKWKERRFWPELQQAFPEYRGQTQDASNTYM